MSPFSVKRKQIIVKIQNETEKKCVKQILIREIGLI